MKEITKLYIVYRVEIIELPSTKHVAVIA